MRKLTSSIIRGVSNTKRWRFNECQRLTANQNSFIERHTDIEQLRRVSAWNLTSYCCISIVLCVCKVNGFWCYSCLSVYRNKKKHTSCACLIDESWRKHVERIHSCLSVCVTVCILDGSSCKPVYVQQVGNVTVDLISATVRRYTVHIQNESNLVQKLKYVKSNDDTSTTFLPNPSTKWKSVSYTKGMSVW